jgi:hypothetical protein
VRGGTGNAAVFKFPVTMSLLYTTETGELEFRAGAEGANGDRRTFSLRRLFQQSFLSSLYEDGLTCLL